MQNGTTGSPEILRAMGYKAPVLSRLLLVIKDITLNIRRSVTKWSCQHLQKKMTYKSHPNFQIWKSKWDNNSRDNYNCYNKLSLPSIYNCYKIFQLYNPYLKQHQRYYNRIFSLTQLHIIPHSRKSIGANYLEQKFRTIPLSNPSGFLKE